MSETRGKTDETRRDWTPRPVSAVYLKGDPAPIIIDLPEDALLAKMADYAMFAAEVDVEVCFLRLPVTHCVSRDAHVRMDSIAAILPATYEGNDEDDD